MSTPAITESNIEFVQGVQSAQGIDVSNYQGDYDWAAAKAQIPDLQFGIYRLTQSLGQPGTNSPDPTAVHNHAAIIEQGLHRGCYHFLDPYQGGAAQARYFVAAADQLGTRDLDMYWLDHETAGSSPAETAKVADDFMVELRRLKPESPSGVYTYIDFAKEGYCHGLGKYALWLAYPNLTAPVPPPPWIGPEMVFWQWGQRGGADTDAFMGTAAQLDTWLRSFTPKTGPFRHVTDGTFSLDELAKRRHTTARYILGKTIQAYTHGDVADLAAVTLPAGVPFYTENP